MKKVVIHKAGSYDRLVLSEFPDPVPSGDQVLVKNEAVGVNFADCIVRMGLYSSATEYVGWPITPGFEFAGVVAAVGDGVTDLSVGDKVFGVTRFDGYATHAVVPRHQLFVYPNSWSPAQAAGFPTVFLTAYFALYALAVLRPGMKILVHSAAGGVGGALVQLAKIAGCEVVGVVGRTHKVELVEKLGADAVIDKSTQNLWKVAERLAPEGYDIVLDANGIETISKSYAHLAPAGKLVVYGFHTMFSRGGSGRPNWLKLAWDYIRTPRFSPLEMTNSNKSVLAFNLSYLFDRTDWLEESMTALLGWAEEGKIETLEVTSYAMADVAKAHRDIESGETVGKLVLVP